MKKQIFKSTASVSAIALTVILAGAGCANVNSPSQPQADNNLENSPKKESVQDNKQEAPVKEFVMTSFYEMKDGKPAPQFSMKEMKVKKGDKVRVKVTNTKGGHDFKIDELGVYADTPLDKEVVIEFIADKAGSFVYYCAKPGHRQNGQWGTLIVE